ncbi:uncharacterized protein KD926_003195 [Aspergillus affinis]|uniref:uncharacterized protein n=1 Tax=Aspergillus affinis TaxID=1070780 RepID=UPI0022FDE337|nr:uncharacterized protein KD926_003195 [Aspergillus affinis]KAI9035626.1 hypothetical protein KD926_003195 [Aspergillus affinis]
MRTTATIYGSGFQSLALRARPCSGKIGLNNFLATIKRADNPRCPCERAPETVAHILLDCSRYEALRFKLWGPDHTYHPRHIRDALTDSKHAPRMAKFLLATGRLPYLREMARLQVTEGGQMKEVPDEVGRAEDHKGDVEEQQGGAEDRDPGAEAAVEPGAAATPGSG